MSASALASPKAGSPAMPSSPSLQQKQRQQQQQQQQQRHKIVAKSPRVGEWTDLDLLASVAALQNYLDMSLRPAPGLDGHNNVVFPAGAASDTIQQRPESEAVPMEVEYLNDAAANGPEDAEKVSAPSHALTGTGVAASYSQEYTAMIAPPTDPIAAEMNAEYDCRAKERVRDSKELRRVRAMLRYASMKVQRNWTQKSLEQVIKDYDHEHQLRKGFNRASKYYVGGRLVYPNLGTASSPDYTSAGGAINLWYATVRETQKVEAGQSLRKPTLDDLAAACAIAAEKLRQEEDKKSKVKLDEERKRYAPLTVTEKEKVERGGGKAPKRRLYVKGPRLPTPPMAQGANAGRGAHV